MLLNCGVGEYSWESQLLHSKGDKSWDFFERTDAEAETPILWPPDVKNWLTGKDPDAGSDWGQEEKETTEDEVVGWHHQLDGHEFEQALGDGKRQGSLMCSSPWTCKELDTPEQRTELNWSELNQMNLSCRCGKLCGANKDELLYSPSYRSYSIELNITDHYFYKIYATKMKV